MLPGEASLEMESGIDIAQRKDYWQVLMKIWLHL
jgi:hypothetical protein